MEDEWKMNEGVLLVILSGRRRSPFITWNNNFFFPLLQFRTFISVAKPHRNLNEILKKEKTLQKKKRAVTRRKVERSYSSNEN